jgi:hypothetical protein
MKLARTSYTYRTAQFMLHIGLGRYHGLVELADSTTTYLVITSMFYRTFDQAQLVRVFSFTALIGYIKQNFQRFVEL